MALISPARYPDIAPETLERIETEFAEELYERVCEKALELKRSGNFQAWLQVRGIASTIFLEAVQKENQ